MSGRSYPMMDSILAAAIVSLGGRVVLVEDGPRDRLDAMLDTLDVLSLIGPDARPRDSMGFRHPHPQPRPLVTHIDTPKPISKRKARRLRGKDPRP